MSATDLRPLAIGASTVSNRARGDDRNFRRMFGAGKSVIAMVHLGDLPGTPLYDADSAVKKALPDTRAIANIGVRHTTLAPVLRVADRGIGGSSRNIDGHIWSLVDPTHAAEFTRLARQARHG